MALWHTEAIVRLDEKAPEGGGKSGDQPSEEKMLNALDVRAGREAREYCLYSDACMGAGVSMV